MRDKPCYVAAEAAILTEFKDELRRAGQIREGGKPLNRSDLIEASGLSRRTAYQILDCLPRDQQ